MLPVAFQKNTPPTAIPHYKYLITYRLAEIIFDLVDAFILRYLSDLGHLSYLSLKDQMLKCARSIKQNIIEGVSEVTSLKSQIKLLGVAYGSVEELIADLEDFARRKNLTLYPKNHPKVSVFRQLGRRLSDLSNLSHLGHLKEKAVLPASCEEAVNLLLTFCHQLSFLLARQIESAENKFIKEGGYTENLFLKRLKYRRLPKLLRSLKSPTGHIFLPLLVIGSLVLAVVFIFFKNFLPAKKPSATPSPVFKRQIFGAWEYRGEIPKVLTASLARTKEGPKIQIQRENSQINFQIPINSPKIDSQKDNYVVYASSDEIIKTKYQLIAKGLKEEIILNRIPSENKLSMKLNLKNLQVKITPENTYVFYDQNGRYQFHFEPPFVKDGAGNISYAVSYQITPIQNNYPTPPPTPSPFVKEKDGAISKNLLGETQEIPYSQDYILTIEIDKNWLYDEKRVLPLIIDPTIVHDESSEFATGVFNRVKDTGSGSSPNLETYYQELPSDINTVGLWHMNENSGSSVADSSGNGNTGTATGTTVVDGFFGKARSFNGTSDYVSVPDNDVLDPKTISIEVWVKPFSSGTNNGNILNKGDNSGYRLRTVGETSTSGYFLFHDRGATNMISSNQYKYFVNQWYYVVVTGDSSGLKMYVNGALAGENTTAYGANNTSNPLQIGACTTFNEYFHGIIDEVRISNRVLSPEEIRANAQRRPYGVYTSPVIDLTGGVGSVTAWNSLSWTAKGIRTGDGETPISTSGLVAQWNFNETSGTTAASGGSCGSSCNGTLNNFANTSGQDVVPGSGWTAQNRRWGQGALMFDGVNDYVSASDNNLPSGNNPFTIAAWVKTSASYSTNTYARVIQWGTEANGQAVVLGIGNDANISPNACFTGAWGDAVSTGIPINDGQWHYCVGVYEGSNVYKIYLDGALKNTKTLGVTTNIVKNGTVYIGRQTSSASYWNGVLDNISVYSRALTPAEVLANYQAGLIEFQTRTSADNSSWENWRPVTGETQLLSMDNDNSNWSWSGILSSWDNNNFQYRRKITLTEPVGLPRSSEAIRYDISLTTGKVSISSVTSVVLYCGGNPQPTDCYATATSGNDVTAMQCLSQINFGASETKTCYLYYDYSYTTPPSRPSPNGWAYSGRTGIAQCGPVYDVPHGTQCTNSTVSIWNWGDASMCGEGDYWGIESWCYVKAPSTGAQSFETCSDDGSNLWVEGTSVVYNQYCQPCTCRSGSYNTTAGRYYKLKFEMQENTGGTCTHARFNSSSYIDSTNCYRFYGNNREISISVTTEETKAPSNPYLDTSIVFNKSTDATIKAEGASSMKVQIGAPQVDGNTVALWHFEETSGTGAYIKDSTANANHGTPTGTTVVDGFFGKGRRFNGTSDYINVPDSSSLRLGTQQTIEVWIKPLANVSDWARIVGKGDNTYRNYGLWRQNDGDILYQIYSAGGNGNCWNDAGPGDILNVSVGTWAYLVATYDGNNMKIYRDGILAKTCPYSQTPYTSNNSLTFAYAGYHTYFNGLIDEVRISNIARSPEEIAESYRAGRDHRLSRTISSTNLSNSTKLPFYVAADRPGTYLEAIIGESAYANYEADSNTIGLWHLEEQSGSGAYIKDSSSYGNHGTPTGTTFVQGKIGKARRFNGSSDYITINNESSFDFSHTSTFSLEAWIKSPGSSSFKTIFSKVHPVSPYQGYLFRLNTFNQLEFVLIKTDVGYKFVYVTATGTNINDNIWHHVAVTYSGTGTASGVKLYLDGTLLNTTVYYDSLEGGPILNDQPLLIGKSNHSTSEYFIGQIDEAKASTTVRTPEEIRQAYEIGRRTHPITIDFVTSPYQTYSSGTTLYLNNPYGTSALTDTLKIGDTIIIRENVNGTEYIAQSTVTNIQNTSSTYGTVTLSSAFSSIPSGGYSTNAKVFKWQREYFDLTGSMASHRDATTRITLRLTDSSQGATFWLDNILSNLSYLSNLSPSSFNTSTGIGTYSTTSIASTPNRYFQYRAIFSSWDPFVSSSLNSITLDYVHNVPPNTPTLDLPSNGAQNQSLTPQLKTTATDNNGDYLRYKIQICTNQQMTENCQTFDQTVSQTGWSGQNTQGGTAYTSGTQATYTIQTPLNPATTYFWRSYAIDPAGSNTWSSTQSSPFSFTTVGLLPPQNCLLEEHPKNLQIVIKWLDPNTTEDGYYIEKSVNGGSFSNLYTTGANATSYTDSSVSANNTYQYRISAKYGSSYSEWCYTPILNLGVGGFRFEGVKMEGVKID